MKDGVVMKIISGKYKGKKLEGYDIEGTRPTQDRIKESLFAMIQGDLRDATVLDLFAGSGNLGIEALSNGASIAYFVDSNPKCIEVLNKNIRGIEKDTTKVYNRDYWEALEYFHNQNIRFDIIFLDPPYQLECLDNIIQKIIEWDLLNIEGIIVCEYEFDNFQKEYNSLTLIKERKYGYKNIKIFYRKREQI